MSHRWDLSSKYLQSGPSLCEQDTAKPFQVSYLNQREILLPAPNNYSGLKQLVESLHKITITVSESQHFICLIII